MGARSANSLHGYHFLWQMETFPGGRYLLSTPESLMSAYLGLKPCMSLSISAWPPAQILALPFSVSAHQPITQAGPLAVCKNCPSTLQLVGNFHLFLEVIRTFCVLVTTLGLYCLVSCGPSANSSARWLALFPCRVGSLPVISLVVDRNLCTQHLRERCTQAHSAEDGTCQSSIHAQSQEHWKSLWKSVAGVGGWELEKV